MSSRTRKAAIEMRMMDHRGSGRVSRNPSTPPLVVVVELRGWGEEEGGGGGDEEVEPSVTMAAATTIAVSNPVQEKGLFR